METIKIRDDFIKLGQAMKLAGLVDSGVDAKIEIQEGFVKVNGKDREVTGPVGDGKKPGGHEGVRRAFVLERDQRVDTHSKDRSGIYLLKCQKSVSCAYSAYSSNTLSFRWPRFFSLCRAVTPSYER